EVVAGTLREVGGELAIGAAIRAQDVPALPPRAPASRIGAVPEALLEERVDGHRPLEPRIDVRVRRGLGGHALRLVPLRDPPRLGEPASVVILERSLAEEQARASATGALPPPPPRAR